MGNLFKVQGDPSWRKQLISDLKVENMDLMNALINKFDFRQCMDILSVMPESEDTFEAEQLFQIFSIVMALVEENLSKKDFKCYPTYDDVLLILSRLKSLKAFYEHKDIEEIIKFAQYMF